MGGDVGEDVEEVGRGVDAIDGDERRGGGNAVTFTGGAGAVKRAGVVPGVVRTVEKVLDNLVGGGDIELITLSSWDQEAVERAGEATTVVREEEDDTEIN